MRGVECKSRLRRNTCTRGHNPTAVCDSYSGTSGHVDSMPKRKKSRSVEEESKDDQGIVSLPRAILPGVASQVAGGSLFRQQQQQHQLQPPLPNDFLTSSFANPMMGADLRRHFFSASSFSPHFNLPPPPSLFPSMNDQYLAMQLRQRIANHDAMVANSGLSNMFSQPNSAISPNLGAQQYYEAERLSLSSGVATRRKSDAFDSVPKSDADPTADSHRKSESEDSSMGEDLKLHKDGDEDDDDEVDFEDEGRKRAATEPFPEKLHKLLNEVENDGKSNIISFTPDGRAFMIHKPEEFFADIVPKYFKQSRLSSFKRQLNLYGFEMITSGPMKGAYFHEHFLRDHPDLCRKLRRRDVKFISRPKNPQGFDASAPNFYSMPPIRSSEEAAALAAAQEKTTPVKPKIDDGKKSEKATKRQR